MKKIILIILISTIVILGLIIVLTCANTKEDRVCNKACIEQGYSSGSCEDLSVMPNPCEEKLGRTSLYDYKSLCDPIETCVQRLTLNRISGRGNVCCCE